MPTLLKIDVSPRGEHSISRALGDTFIQTWKAKHPGSQVLHRDLATTSLPFVEMPWILGAYSEPAGHNDEQKAALAIGEELIAELKAADEWLITTPMYNFAPPARLKAYIDHIVRSGLTFRANQDGTYQGLLEGKRATIILASMGEYGPGAPAESYDHLSPYMRLVLGFIGVTDVTILRAGSTWKVDRGVEDRAPFLAAFAQEVEAAAAR